MRASPWWCLGVHHHHPRCRSPVDLRSAAKKSVTAAVAGERDATPHVGGPNASMHAAAGLKGRRAVPPEGIAHALRPSWEEGYCRAARAGVLSRRRPKGGPSLAWRGLFACGPRLRGRRLHKLDPATAHLGDWRAGLRGVCRRGWCGPRRRWRCTAAGAEIAAAQRVGKMDAVGGGGKIEERVRADSKTFAQN